MKWAPDHVRNASRFSSGLRKNGFDFFTGVPCSLLGALLENLFADRTVTYVPATREDGAIAMAGGAWLAGRKPAVLMQNSGLGYSLNVLTSLNLIYRIPVLLLVTYRGHGPDAPEHWVMGRSCEAILKETGIEARVPEADGIRPALDWACERLVQGRRPVVILIKRGIFGT
jgi:phosphonopyruvate decarboxylase